MMFRTRLRQLREDNGYKSQQAFADAFGVAQSTVGNWEAGKRKPNHATTIRLAKFLNTSVDYLMGVTDQRKEPAPKNEDGPVLPPGYEFLNPANKAIIDRLMAENKETVNRLVADLVKSQPPSSEIKLEAAALDGGRHETEADAPITLPERSVQALSDKYKGKTADTDPAPQEK